jgi:hypothetical protein
LLRKLPDNDSAGCVDKLGELIEMLGHHLSARSACVATRGQCIPIVTA